MQLGMSEKMGSTLDKILENSEPVNLYISATMTNYHDPKFKMAITDISDLIIIQAFEENCFTCMEMVFQLSPAELVEFYEHTQDMVCRLTMHLTDKDEPTKKELYWQQTLRIIIPDKNDIFKQINKASLLPSDREANDAQEHVTFPVTVQLMTPAEYELRKIRVNFLMKQATINDALLTLAHSFKIKKTHIVPPDNKAVYNNLLIPPMHSFHSVFSFLQSGSGKGVYNQGLSCYYQDDRLYIYPPFNVTQNSKNIIQIYKCPEGYLDESDAYHSELNGSTRIICNTPVSSIRLGDTVLENEGSAIMALHGDKIIDGYNSVNDKGSLILKDLTTTDKITSKEGITSDIFSPIYKFSKGNMFVHASTISLANLEQLRFGWQMALPFTFTPGGKVIYSYDDDSRFMTKEGQCRKVTYHLAPVEQFGQTMFNCAATITLLVNT